MIKSMQKDDKIDAKKVKKPIKAIKKHCLVPFETVFFI